MAKKLRPLELDWINLRQCYATVRAGDRLLTLAVQEQGPKRYMAFAVEVAAPGTDALPVAGKKRIAAMEAGIADHAHKLIGEFKTAHAAVKAAEAYGRKWKRARVREKKCDCKEITA